MRYVNILLFLAVTVLGGLLSLGAMLKLPFAIFTVPSNGFSGAIQIIKAGADLRIDTFSAVSALNEVIAWGGAINYLVAVICSILMVLPVLLTMFAAEGMLFNKRATFGWRAIAFMVTLGALVMGIEPVPAMLRWYLLGITLMTAIYIVTYQWPKKATRSGLTMPTLQRRPTPPHDIEGAGALRQS